MKKIISLHSAVLVPVLFLFWLLAYRNTMWWMEGMSFFSTLPDFAVLQARLPAGAVKYAAAYLLQFYHDAAPESAAGPVADGLVAFRLDSTFNEPDTTINITLQWNSYSGTKTHTFKYKPRKD